MAEPPTAMDLLSIYDADTQTLRDQLRSLDQYLQGAGAGAASSSYACMYQQRDCICLELQERMSSEAAAAGMLRSIAPPQPSHTAAASLPGSVSHAEGGGESAAGETTVMSSGVTVPTVGGKTLAQRLADERRAEKRKKAQEKAEKAERDAAAQRAREAEGEAAAQRAALAQRLAAERLKEMKRKAAAAKAKEEEEKVQAVAKRHGGERSSDRASSNKSSPSSPAVNIRVGSSSTQRPNGELGSPAARPRASSAEGSPRMAASMTSSARAASASSITRGVAISSGLASNRASHHAGGKPTNTLTVPGRAAASGERERLCERRQAASSVDGRADSKAARAARIGGWTAAPDDSSAGDGGASTPSSFSSLVGGMASVVTNHHQALTSSPDRASSSSHSAIRACGDRDVFIGLVMSGAVPMGRSATEVVDGCKVRCGEASTDELGKAKAAQGTLAVDNEFVVEERVEADHELEVDEALADSTRALTACEDASGLGIVARTTLAGREPQLVDIMLGPAPSSSADAVRDASPSTIRSTDGQCLERLVFRVGSLAKTAEMHSDENLYETAAFADAEYVHEEEPLEQGDKCGSSTRREWDDESEEELDDTVGSIIEQTGEIMINVDDCDEEVQEAIEAAGEEPEAGRSGDMEADEPIINSPSLPHATERQPVVHPKDAGLDPMAADARLELAAFAAAADYETDSELNVKSEADANGADIYHCSLGPSDETGDLRANQEQGPGSRVEVEPNPQAREVGPDPNGGPANRPDTISPLARLQRMYPEVNIAQLRAVLCSFAQGEKSATEQGNGAVTTWGGSDDASFSNAVVAAYRHAFLHRKSLAPAVASGNNKASVQVMRDLASRYPRFEDLWCNAVGSPSGMMPPPEILSAQLTLSAGWDSMLTSVLGAVPSPPWGYRYVRIAYAKPEVYEIVRDFCSASNRGSDEARNACHERSGGALPGAVAPGTGTTLPRWLELPDSADDGSPGAAGWNLQWTWKSPRTAFAELLPWQRVNHFPHSRNLTRKDLLKKHLQRARSMPGRSEAYDIMPLTFALPAEYNAFAMAFAECRDEAEAAGGGNIWIMKPTGSGASRGRRITLLNDITGVSYGEAVVLQRYIERPLLLDGFKFDLRLYVLVTSFNPLECFLYSEGFGRFSTERYTLDPNRLGDQYIHLTNSSIQKERPIGEGERNSIVDSEEGGSKCSLSSLAEQLRAAGMPWASIWTSVKEVILRSLAAVQDAIPHQRNSFELFGYDVLIDESLKCWLIEVNASPSLARENPLDFHVKDRLLSDTLQLVAPPYFDRAVWSEMVRRRVEQRSDARRAGKIGPTTEIQSELCALLHGEPPRAYGQMPAHLGLYERIAPSPLWDRIGRRNR